jgi:hypothetical protein
MVNTRPGGILHIVSVAAVFVYVLVVELCEMQLAPFGGFVPEMKNLGVLRLALALIGLADLGIACTVLWRPFLVRSVGSAFLLAYAVLEAPAVYGLVLFLLDGRRLDFYPFAALSLVSLLVLWTQAERWDELAASERHDMEETGAWHG